jgi:hypothetical protein
MGSAMALMGLAGACGELGQPDIAQPPVLGQPFVAGAGDTVMDASGRTRAGGRVIVRYVGLERGQALFVRQDVLIPSNEATMSRMPMILPTPQKTAGGGVSVVQASVVQPTTGTATGMAYVPPSPSAFTPNQAGQIQVAAPPGGSVIVDGHRINFLRPVEGGIEYSVN